MNIRDSASCYDHSSKHDHFSPFAIQHEGIFLKSPETKARPITSQRLVHSIAIQTDNPLPVFSNSSIQRSIPDDNSVFVKSIEFLLHAEMD